MQTEPSQAELDRAKKSTPVYYSDRELPTPVQYSASCFLMDEAKRQYRLRTAGEQEA